MAVQYVVTNAVAGAVALAAATAKTPLEITSTANVPPELIALDVSVDATTTGTLLIEIATITTTGTGTSFTPKRLGAATGVAASTSKVNDTVEPTYAASPQILAWRMALPGGPFCYQWPLGRELMLPVSTIYGVRLTSSIVTNALVSLTIEE